MTGPRRIRVTPAGWRCFACTAGNTTTPGPAYPAVLRAAWEAHHHLTHHHILTEPS